MSYGSTINNNLLVGGNLDINNNLNFVNQSGGTITTLNNNKPLNIYSLGLNLISDYFTIGVQSRPSQIDLCGNLNFLNQTGGKIISLYNNITYTDLTIDASNIDISGNLTVGSQTNPSITNLYGNLNFLNTSTSNATISFGGNSNSPALSSNNLSDGNLYMNTGLDISGNLIFTKPMNGIRLNENTDNDKILCFPSLSNAFNQWTTESYVPYGLGVTWNYQGYGETDLIGYGGGSPYSGGVSIYSYNTNNGSIGGNPGSDNKTLIANFFQDSSTIYTKLNVVGSLVINNNNNYGNYNQTFTLTDLGQYVFFSLQSGTGAFIIVTMTTSDTYNQVNMYSMSCINTSTGIVNRGNSVMINPQTNNELNFSQTGVPSPGFQTYPSNYPATMNISFLNAIFSTFPYVYIPPP